MEKIPFISIVIPTTGNVKFIKGLVKSVDKLDYPKDKFELILIGDEKTDLLERNIKKANDFGINTLLKKFKDNTHLIKGNSNTVLQKIDMEKIDFIFLDGGHDYDTVMNDLNLSKEVIIKNGVILCDDYNLSYAPGVKKAIDEYVEKNNFQKKILLNNRFALIEKK